MTRNPSPRPEEYLPYQLTAPCFRVFRCNGHEEDVGDHNSSVVTVACILQEAEHDPL